MKKILFILMMLPVAVFGQNDVTTFLGIPVDGTKTAFIQKLKAKGFITDNIYDLKGQFNGNDVYIDVQTNNNKVSRIVVTYQNLRKESDIVIDYNNLIEQFRKNGRYAEYPLPNELIEEGENVSYQITCKNKRYQAIFYQRPVEYAPEDIENLSTIQERLDSAQSSRDLSANLKVLGDINGFWRKYLMNKLVWFMIYESYGRYTIAIFYENKLNTPNGEDL